jgi:hypothetical protein
MIINNSLNTVILDEVISFFENNVVICGSITDYVHVGYSGHIGDMDLTISIDNFFKYFQLSELINEFVFNDFQFRKKHVQMFNRSSYIGKYKNDYTIDIFIEDSETEPSILIDSKILVANSNYAQYKIHSFNTRRARLEKLLKLEKKQDYPQYRNDWIDKKIKQATEKLLLYNKLNK